MEWSEERRAPAGRPPHPSGDQTRLDDTIRAVPRRLVGFLAGLAYLSDEGRRLALRSLGPGSRIVLEVLRVAEEGEGAGLTGHGARVAERLADRQAPEVPGVGEAGRLGARLRRIARIVPVDAYDLAAASTGDEPQGPRRVTYELSPDPGARATDAGATVEVARAVRELRLWQRGGNATVVVLGTMESLPSSGRPLALPNPDDEPPSALLRHRLALSEEG
ncbi:hypothetical protein WDH52_17630 [Streptomyces sp. TRM70308]|uniref:hypothetical protein n=1 Tax=Streptomyces sp. TRM70308 TaxID=3131932 RepID=UPI003CFF3EE3